MVGDSRGSGSGPRSWSPVGLRLPGVRKDALNQSDVVAVISVHVHSSPSEPRSPLHLLISCDSQKVVLSNEHGFRL